MGTANGVECALGSPTKGKRQRCDLYKASALTMFVDNQHHRATVVTHTSQ